MAVCQVVIIFYVKYVCFISLAQSKKMENVMTEYISVEPDGSIRKLTASNLIDATEQYYKSCCSGELHLKIPFEQQPLLYRKNALKEVSDFFGGKQCNSQ